MSVKKETPLWSIVVPVYNGETYLHHTIDSILAAPDQNLEILLVDNGSVDGSSRICREYAEKNSRVRYMMIEERGIVSARNYGMQAARGKYISFCDQDDEMKAGIYMHLIRKMHKHAAQMGICSVGRIIDGRRSAYETLCDSCCQGNEILEKILYPLLFCGYQYPFFKYDNYLYGTIWKCVFQADFLREYQMQFRSFVDYEDDWLFVTEALCHANMVLTVSDTGYYWRINAESRSHQKRFIPDIWDRFEQLDVYVLSYLEDRINDKSILDQYRKVRMFEHYSETFKNEPDSRKEKRKYQKEAADYLKRTDYRKQLACCRYLQRHAYRKQMIYRSLLIAGIRGTFLISRLLSMGETAAERIPWLVQWERRKKMGTGISDR